MYAFWQACECTYNTQWLSWKIISYLRPFLMENILLTMWIFLQPFKKNYKSTEFNIKMHFNIPKVFHLLRFLLFNTCLPVSHLTLQLSSIMLPYLDLSTLLSCFQITTQHLKDKYGSNVFSRPLASLATAESEMDRQK